MQIDRLRSFLEEKIFLKNFEEESRLAKIPVTGRITGSFLEFAVFISKPESILEIGCGNGFSTYFLVKNMQDTSFYTGIDLNKKRLAFAMSVICERFPDKNIEFIFNHTGALKGDVNCNLFIDDNASGYISSVSPNVNTLIHANSSLEEGSHEWHMNCSNDTHSEKSKVLILNVTMVN